jgi:hypothetical protein
MSNSERWKPIAGFEDKYEVSDLGRVRRISKDHGATPGYIFNPKPNNKGYIMIALRRPGESRTLRLAHRIVLEAFVGPCPPNHVTNHKNCDKTDNRLENLEWVSQAYNVEHAIANDHFYFAAKMGEKNPASKLTADQVREIRRIHAKTQCRYQDLADQFGVTNVMIGKIVRREAWPHIE